MAAAGLPCMMSSAAATAVIPTYPQRPSGLKPNEGPKPSILYVITPSRSTRHLVLDPCRSLSTVRLRCLGERYCEQGDSASTDILKVAITLKRIWRRIRKR